MGQGGMGHVTIRYWAAARDVAGVVEDQVDADTLAGAVAAATALRGGRLLHVLRLCAFLVDDQPVGRRDHAEVELRDGAVVEALPPFAGG